ncbi:MAG: hypothetical protein DWQ36_07940 [Acidobacteria bacterium]|nr:MAG: hypothetical protein DWQ30_03885 [Acidobacteriota bacterium]REK08893.1 MAG: hypothetical protein DWQ36_07940 [Acidobacteriota bacterium]
MQEARERELQQAGGRSDDTTDAETRPLGRRAEALHRSLFEAYFRDHRDITSADVLADLWRHAGLGECPRDASRWEARVRAEHREALFFGASGAPAVRAEVTDPEAKSAGVLMGAQPTRVYRSWFEKLARG